MKLLKLVPDGTNIDFLKFRVPFFTVSIALTIASWALVAFNGLNLGVDFVGGQMIRVSFTQQAEAPIGEMRSEIAKLGYGEPIIQRYGDANEASIRMKLPEGADEDPELANTMAERITGQLKETYPDVRIDGVDSVSGKVSDELFETGLISLLAAMVAIAIYIWIRFEWQFGVGALFALVHDVSLTMGFFALTQLEFDLNIIAAILTIIGYSLNDTIVVYDRIRENLKKYRKKHLPDLLNLSVNETLARTVMTSLTLLIALLPLVLFGPSSLFGMTIAITLGIFIGTYSSIYMAAPILIWLGVTSDSFVPVESATDRQEKAARERS